MTIAVADGDPPDPPFHLRSTLLLISNTLEQVDVRKNHLLPLFCNRHPPSTQTYDGNVVAPANDRRRIDGHNLNDHDRSTTIIRPDPTSPPHTTTAQPNQWVAQPTPSANVLSNDAHDTQALLESIRRMCSPAVVASISTAPDRYDTTALLTSIRSMCSPAVIASIYPPTSTTNNTNAAFPTPTPTLSDIAPPPPRFDLEALNASIRSTLEPSDANPKRTTGLPIATHDPDNTSPTTPTTTETTQPPKTTLTATITTPQPPSNSQRNNTPDKLHGSQPEWKPGALNDRAFEISQPLPPTPINNTNSFTPAQIPKLDHNHTPDTKHNLISRTNQPTCWIPWIRDSFHLVFQAADRLEDAIADMSAAIAALSASVASLPPSKPPFDSHQPLRRLPPPPIDPQQPTFPPRSPGTPLSRHRSRSILPLPSTHPPPTGKTTLANMRSQPHTSPSLRALLLRMAKHNYRPP